MHPVCGTYARNGQLESVQEQLQRGETISLSMDELRAMEKEDWKPTEKVRKFMENN